MLGVDPQGKSLACASRLSERLRFGSVTAGGRTLSLTERPSPASALRRIRSPAGAPLPASAKARPPRSRPRSRPLVVVQSRPLAAPLERIPQPERARSPWSLIFVAAISTTLGDILPACQLRGVAVAPPLSRVGSRATHARRRERSTRRHDAGPWLRCHPHWPQPRPRIAWKLKLRELKHAVSVVRSRSGNGKPGRRGTSISSTSSTS